MVSGILHRSEEEKPTAKLYRLLVKWSSRFPFLYISLLEIRSLVFRIRLARRLDIYRKGIGFGPMAEADTCAGVRLCRRTDQRIQDMQKIFQGEWGMKNPSWTDLKLFLSAWDCGEEWKRKSRDIDNKKQVRNQLP
jgi:hypothetical protein